MLDRGHVYFLESRKAEVRGLLFLPTRVHSVGCVGTNYNTSRGGGKRMSHPVGSVFSDTLALRVRRVL